MIDLKRGESDFIQIGRGIAVMIVLLFHYTSRIPYEIMGSSTPPVIEEHIGKIGVNIFFIISGYLISKTLDRSANLGAFYARRVSRLWPLYVFACVFVFVFASVFAPPVILSGHNTFYNVRPTLLDLFSNFFFLNDATVSVDGAYWSIVAEVKFYFWLGIFAVLFRKNYIKAFCWAAIALSVLDFSILAFTSSQVADYGGKLRPLSMLLHGVFISEYLPFFALGAVMQRGERYQFIAPLAALALFYAVTTISEDNDFVATQDLQFLVLLGGLLALDRLLLAGKVFIWIGDYSYAIYLFHQVVGLTIIKMLTPRTGIDVAIVLALAFVVALSAAASWAVEWRFRRPLTQLLERAFAVIGLDRLPILTGEGEPAPAPVPVRREPAAALDSVPGG